jgi:hypothetical protein
MIVLLLERCFGVRFSDLDHLGIDVKPDVHIIRVFSRLGFIQEPTEKEALEGTRRLNPEYPGALDAPTLGNRQKMVYAFLTKMSSMSFN